MTAVPEQRSTLRRQVNSLGMRGGEAQESKFFGSLGKCFCLWLLWKYADSLIVHYEALLVLMVILVAPDLLKKLITMRYPGGQGGFTERTEHTEHSVAVNKVGAPEVP